MATHYPHLGTVDEIVRLLEQQAKAHHVERREGFEPTPWAWLQEATLHEPGRQADIGEALSRLLVLGDYCTSYALDQVYRSGSEVLAPIWQNLGTIGPGLADVDLPESNESPLANLLRYLMTGVGRVPHLPDEAVDFLVGVKDDAREEAWPLALLIAAGARPDAHSATFAEALEKMSDKALEEVIMTMMVKPVPYMKQAIDAIAALDDAPRKRFAGALKKVVDQRTSDRAYLLQTHTDPAKRQKILDGEAYDQKMGLDWPSLESRLKP